MSPSQADRVTVAGKLVRFLRDGVKQELSASVATLGFEVEKDINSAIYYPALARFDAARMLLDVIGVCDEPEPEDVVLDLARWPDLVPEALESQLEIELGRLEDAHASGFDLPARDIPALECLVADIRRQVDAPARRGRLQSLLERLRHAEAHLSDRRPASPNWVVQLRGAKYLLLESERVDGTWVATPMWFAVVDDTVFLRTDARAAKVRRISHRPVVKVAPCTIRGKPLDDYMECMARIVPQEREAQAEAALRRRNGPLRRLFSSFVRNDHVYLELNPINLNERSRTEDAALSCKESAANHAGAQLDDTSPDAA